jgi:hypothetical protein
LIIDQGLHDDLFNGHPDILTVLIDFMADRPLSATRLSAPAIPWLPVEE